MTSQDAARCLLEGLKEAGLKHVPNGGAKKIKVLYVCNDTTQESQALLQAISQKGLNVYSDFARIRLKSGEDSLVPLLMSL